MKKLIIFIVFAFFCSNLFAQNYNSLDSVNKEIQETYTFIDKYEGNLYVKYMPDNDQIRNYMSSSELKLKDDLATFSIEWEDSERKVRHDGSYLTFVGLVEMNLANLKRVTELSSGVKLFFTNDGVSIKGKIRHKPFSTWDEKQTNISENNSEFVIQIENVEMLKRMYNAFNHLAAMQTKKRALLQKASGDKF